MYGYVEKMINEFPINISNIDTSLTPDGNNIFFKDNRKSIGKKKDFHTSVVRGMFGFNRARPVIHQPDVVLSTRVKEPNKNY